MNSFHYFVSASSTQFQENLSKHHKDCNTLISTNQGYPYFQTKKSFQNYHLFTARWAPLLIQQNQVLKSIFFIINKRNIYKFVANRKLNTKIKKSGNSIEQVQPIEFLRFLVKFLNLFLLPLVNNLTNLLKFNM